MTDDAKVVAELVARITFLVPDLNGTETLHTLLTNSNPSASRQEIRPLIRTTSVLTDA
jgi:hypothetical protein